MAFVQAADQLGIRAIIASQGEHSIISAYARGIHIDFANEQQAFNDLLHAAHSHHFVAVIGTDDMTTELASRLSQQLGLPHNTPESVRIARRKDLARDRLAACQVAKPVHRCIDLRQELFPQLVEVEYPVVIKPVGLSASRGVIRADDQQQLLSAIERVSTMLQNITDLEAEVADRLLVEQYISGAEVAVEAMLSAGELTILTIFDKPDPMEGPFFEETYYITPSRLSLQKQTQLKDVIAQACQAYGLREGPVHAECRINDDGVYVLEVAARTIGGLCARLLRFGTGYSLEELVLSHAMGQSPDLYSDTGAAGVLMIPIPAAGMLKRIEGILAAQRVPFIEEINIQVREGYELVPLPEGAGYLGFIFARAPDAQQAEQALREAHACLKIVIAPVWKLEQATSCVA